MSKKANKKPKVAPKKTDVTISGNTVKTSYTVPSSATNSNSSTRFKTVTTIYYQTVKVAYDVKKTTGKGKKKKTKVVDTKYKTVDIPVGTITKSYKSTSNSSKTSGIKAVGKGKSAKTKLTKFKSDPYQKVKNFVKIGKKTYKVVGVTGVKVKTSGNNDSKKSGPKGTDKLTIKEFSKPTIKESSFDSTNGVLAFEYSTEQGTDDGKLPFDKLCYYVRYVITTSSDAADDLSYSQLAEHAQSSNKSVTQAVNVPSWDALQTNQRIVVQAISRVKAKNSSKSLTYKKIEKTLAKKEEIGWSDRAIYTRIFSRPPSYTINGALVQDGILFFTMEADKTTSRWPVDKITLQILESSTVTSLAGANTADGWQTLQDNGIDVTGRGRNDEGGLSCHIPNVTAGNKVYFRVLSVHDQYTTEGPAVNSTSPGCAALAIIEVDKTASMSDAKCEIIDYSDNFDSGDKALIYVGYKAKGNRQGVMDILNNWSENAAKYDYKSENVFKYDTYDYGDGTEISWSDDSDIWESTEQPSTYNLTKDDAEVHKNTFSDTEWARGSHVYIKGLTQNVPYYVRARRYGTSTDDFKFTDDETEKIADTAYGPYSNQVKVIPTSTPKRIELKTTDDKSFVFRGKSIGLYWTFTNNSNSNVTQRAYIIINADTNDILVAEETSRMSTSIDASIFDSSVKTVNVKLYVTTAPRTYNENSTKFDVYKENLSAGSWGVSDILTFEIVDRPTVEISSVPDTVTEMPFSFVVNASTGSQTTSQEMIVSATIKSENEMVFGRPDGEHIQLEDEVIWSDDFSTYDREEDAYSNKLTVEVPTNFMLIDGKSYRIEVSVRNIVTKLGDNISREEGYEQGSPYYQTAQARMAKMEKVFNVDLAHKAVDPKTLGIRLRTPVQNGYGLEKRSVEFTSTANSSVIGSDSLEVWRVTPDGFYKIGGNIAIGSTFVDNYAPFANGNAPLYYAIGVRTKDGDIQWNNFPYAIRSFVLRFDWDGKYLELPWNNDISDSYEKNFESRDKLDGTHAGYFTPGFKRNGTLKSTVFKVDHRTRIMLKSIAEHPGAVFVRTPDGSAYAANVTVSDIAYNHDEKTYDVSISTEEIDLPDEFKINGEDYFEGMLISKSVKDADEMDMSEYEVI